VEKKLILGILHRKCHKNFEEEEQQNFQDQKYGNKSLNQYEMSQNLSMSGGVSDLINKNLSFSD